MIAGAGDVGYHLAKFLTDEAHDITLIDFDQATLDEAGKHLDVMTVQGDATEFKVLRQARVDQADLYITVTNSEEINLTSSIFGKKLGAKQTIARISKMQYLLYKDLLDIRKELGIDELISPESLAAREIKHLLRTNAASESVDFENGKVTLLGLDVEDDAPVINHTIADVVKKSGKRDYVIVAIQRGSETIIPKGHTVIQKGDHLFVITHQEGTEEVLHITGKRKINIRNLMILGGSRTGRHLARRLSKHYHISLVEKDPEVAEDLANDFSDIMVVQGDGTNVTLLEEEGIHEMDAFVAVTGNSETNILSCLVAKSRGVKKTIALVENIEYLNLSHNIGIDSLINKKLIAANFIYRYIRKGSIVTLTTIHGVAAEVLEFEVKPNARITRKPIRDLHFPGNAILGGIIRDNKGLIPTGDFTIQAGDKVVVFTLLDCVDKVERYFR